MVLHIVLKFLIGSEIISSGTFLFMAILSVKSHTVLWALCESEAVSKWVSA